MRQATLEDAAAIQALAVAAYSPWIEIIGSRPLPVTADYSQMILEHDVWLTGAPAQLDASLVLKHEKSYLTLWSVAVSPKASGRGLGKHLLNFTIQRIQALRFPEVHLFTNVKMESNKAWYEREGFREVNRRMIGDKHVIYMIRQV